MQTTRINMADENGLTLEKSFDDGMSICECNRLMLETRTEADVQFIVGESKTPLHAHKYVLVSRNSVFRAMLCGPLAESDKSIHVPDIEADIFIIMLRFLYTEEADLNDENVLPILYGARKYNVLKLAEMCTGFLEKEIAESNVIGLLEHAIRFDELELQDKCLYFINMHTLGCLTSPEFCFLSKESMVKILDSDSLEAPEVDIYHAVMKWARASMKRNETEPSMDNIRSFLADVVYQIRFPLIDAKFFTDQIVPTGLLTTDENLEVMCTFNSDKFKAKQFKTSKRNNKLRVRRCSRFGSTSNAVWGYALDKVDSIKFKVDQDIVLVGFTIHRCFKECAVKYTVSYTVLKDGIGHFAEQTVKVETCPTQDETDVFFAQSLDVYTEEEIELKLQITGPYSIRGTGGKTEVEKSGVVFLFTDGTFSAEHRTNTEKGQIPSLLFQFP